MTDNELEKKLKRVSGLNVNGIVIRKKCFLATIGCWRVKEFPLDSIISSTAPFVRFSIQRPCYQSTTKHT